jgi:hypothetical protein
MVLLRDRIGRTILYTFGLLAMSTGALALLGFVSLETPMATFLVGLGGVLNGLAVIRLLPKIKPGQRIGDR